jgi:hypothetical protein
MADVGRPSVYTVEIAERICMEMGQGPVSAVDLPRRGDARSVHGQAVDYQ